MEKNSLQFSTFRGQNFRKKADKKFFLATLTFALKENRLFPHSAFKLTWSWQKRNDDTFFKEW